MLLKQTHLDHLGPLKKAPPSFLLPLSLFVLLEKKNLDQCVQFPFLLTYPESLVAPVKGSGSAINVPLLMVPWLMTDSSSALCKACFVDLGFLRLLSGAL